jgi:hypothetical protein
LEGVGPELEILEDGDKDSSGMEDAAAEHLPFVAPDRDVASCMRAFFLSMDNFWKGRRRFSFLQRSARVSFSNSQSSGLSHPIS